MNHIIKELQQVGALKTMSDENIQSLPYQAKVIMVCNSKSIKELVKEISEKRAEEEDIKIVETIHLSWDEFKEFGNDFMKPRPWLAGKGGVDGAIKILPPKEYPIAFVVNPEGYDYARYVGFDITE